MNESVIMAKAIRPIRNYRRELLHDIGDTVIVLHWSEVLRTCTVLDKDGADCQTGIPIEWLERVDTSK